MKRKLQFYTLFLVMMAILVISNSCNATYSPTEPINDNQSYPIGQPDQPQDAYPPADSAEPPSSQTPSADETPVNRIPAGGSIGLEERVYVDSIDIFIQESFPVQVSVQVYGNLPDGCTTIKETGFTFDDKNTFEVHLFTSRPKDMACTQALVPFEENIPLDVYGLPAGTYTVKVYDLESTFTLDVENK
jgi:hypothetical protein